MSNRVSRWARNKRTAEYLNISEMTLWRWKRNPALNFPAPTVIIKIEHNDLDEIDAWLKCRAISRVKKIDATEAV